MKLTFYTACLLAFTIDVVFSFELLTMKRDSSQCTNSPMAQSCLRDIQKTLNNRDTISGIAKGKENVVEILTYVKYNSCAEFVNAISGIGSCTLCPSENVHSTDSECCTK